MKTSTGFKKREARKCESARANEQKCDSEGEISFPRPRTLAISSLEFYKTIKFQTCLEFSCKKHLAFNLYIKRRGSRSRVALTEHNRLVLIQTRFKSSL